MTFLPIIYFKVFLGLVFIEVSYFSELQNWLQKQNPENGATINLLLMFDALTPFPPNMWPIFIKSLD